MSLRCLKKMKCNFSNTSVSLGLTLQKKKMCKVTDYSILSHPSFTTVPSYKKHKQRETLSYLTQFLRWKKKELSVI